jgi:hypothetical protein
LAKQSIRDAMRSIREAKNQLRAHSRRSRRRRKAVPADERLRRKIERARVAVGCRRCGGRFHESCGVNLSVANPRGHHGRVVVAAKRAKAAAAAQAAQNAEQAAPVFGVEEGSGKLPTAPTP